MITTNNQLITNSCACLDHNVKHIQQYIHWVGAHSNIDGTQGICLMNVFNKWYWNMFTLQTHTHIYINIHILICIIYTYILFILWVNQELKWYWVPKMEHCDRNGPLPRLPHALAQVVEGDHDAVTTSVASTWAEWGQCQGTSCARHSENMGRSWFDDGEVAGGHWWMTVYWWLMMVGQW